MPFEGARQFIRNHLRMATLEMVPLEHLDQLAVLEQRNGR
jgi:hypothetical protein